MGVVVPGVTDSQLVPFPLAADPLCDAADLTKDMFDQVASKLDGVYAIGSEQRRPPMVRVSWRPNATEPNFVHASGQPIVWNVVEANTDGMWQPWRDRANVYMSRPGLWQANAEFQVLPNALTPGVMWELILGAGEGNARTVDIGVNPGDELFVSKAIKIGFADTAMYVRAGHSATGGATPTVSGFGGANMRIASAALTLTFLRPLP